MYIVESETDTDARSGWPGREGREESEDEGKPKYCSDALHCSTRKRPQQPSSMMDGGRQAGCTPPSAFILSLIHYIPICAVSHRPASLSSLTIAAEAPGRKDSIFHLLGPTPLEIWVGERASEMLMMALLPLLLLLLREHLEIN